MRRYLPRKLKLASRLSMLPSDTEPPRNMSIVDPGEVNHIIKELNLMYKPSS
jgi:hypothetical protein